MMCYIGAAPSVVLDLWHLGETQFANLFLPVISGFVIGAWLSGRMAGLVPSTGSRNGVSGGQLTGATLTVALNALIEAPPLLLQQLLITLIAVGVQLVSPTLSLRMLDLFSEGTGIRRVGAVLRLYRDLGNSLWRTGAAGERLAADAWRNVLVCRAGRIRTVAGPRNIEYRSPIGHPEATHENHHRKRDAFGGPANSSNGGYFAGLVATLASDTLAVRLLKPPPLDVELEVVDRGEEGAFTVRHGDVVVGEAKTFGVAATSCLRR